MKILYAAGPRIGAGEQARRIIEFMPEHEFKVCAYSFHQYFISQFDWCLDFLNTIWHKTPALKSIYKDGKLTPQLEILAQEIGEFEPDICICDGEPIIASLCKLINIPFYYCSPLHLIDGINLNTKDYFYQWQLDQGRMKIATWPEPERCFIYAPYKNYNLAIKSGYEFINPFSKTTNNKNEELDLSLSIVAQRCKSLLDIISKSDFDGVVLSKSKINSHKIYGLSLLTNDYLYFLNRAKWIFTTGEISFVADCLQTGADLYISPSLHDYESIINACLFKILNIGTEVGQLELMDKLSIQEFNFIYHKNNEKKECIKMSGQLLNEVI